MLPELDYQLLPRHLHLRRLDEENKVNLEDFI